MDCGGGFAKMPADCPPVGLLHQRGNLLTASHAFVRKPALSQLFQSRKRGPRLPGHQVPAHFTQRLIFVVVAELVDRLALAAQPIGHVQILPARDRIAEREAIAGALQHFPGHLLGQLLGGQKLAQLVVGQHAAGFVVAAVPARHAGFPKSQSPGGEHDSSAIKPRPVVARKVPLAAGLALNRKRRTGRTR